MTKGVSDLGCFVENRESAGPLYGPTDPMLLWMMSTPFERIFGSEDGGQTNDGPLVGEGKLLSGHASLRFGNPDHGPAYRLQVSLIDDRRTVSQVHGPGI